MISIRCQVCQNQITYVRIRSGEGVCAACGAVLPAEQVKAQKEAQIQAIKQASIDKPKT